jgi:programmed cell death protein 5
MDELDAIRERRRRELEAQQSEAAAAGQDPAVAEQAALERAAQEDAALESFLQQILEPEARERLTRIRMSRPQLADTVARSLVSAAQQGRLNGRIGDEHLRRLLSQAQPESRDINITRK